MVTVKALYDRIGKVDINKISTDLLTETIDVYGEINLSQLYDGKTRTGENLSPTYLEDPYFKTYEQAVAYSDWKDRITPNPKRTRFVPNLIINGYYYSSRKIKVEGDKIIYSSEYIEQEIVDKYGEEINGLGGEYRDEFLFVYLYPGLKVMITAATGLSFNKK